MTTVDSSITLASKLGSLPVKELELKSTQDELTKTKKIMVDKVRIVTKLQQKMKISENKLNQGSGL